MAWTITETVDAYKTKTQAGDELIEVKLECISDASGTDTELTAETIRQIKGSWLYQMKVVPGTGDDAPTAAFDIDIEDEADFHILDTDSNSVSAITVTGAPASRLSSPPFSVWY
jgi:hypothetical protein